MFRLAVGLGAGTFDVASTGPVILIDDLLTLAGPPFAGYFAVPDSVCRRMSGSVFRASLEVWPGKARANVEGGPGGLAPKEIGS